MVNEKCPIHNNSLTFICKVAGDIIYSCSYIEEHYTSITKKLMSYVYTHIIKLTQDGEWYQVKSWSKIGGK